LRDQPSSDDTRIREAYRTALLRQPTALEIQRAQSFLDEETSLLASAAPEHVVGRNSTPSHESPTRDELAAMLAGSWRGPGLGPGSASATAVGKLAPGVAQPRVYRLPVAEMPATPQEGAWSLFNQALFASAEFRYLQ
jgi:hypothetical protein